MAQVPDNKENEKKTIETGLQQLQNGDKISSCDVKKKANKLMKINKILF